jgi:hypothetical protein
MAGVELNREGERALREAEAFCWRWNVGIMGPEFLLAGALVVLANRGQAGLPSKEALDRGLTATWGAGAEALKVNVKWGSGAIAAMNRLAGTLRLAGATDLGPRELALGIMEAAELRPGFYEAIGTTRDELAAGLGSGGEG